MLPRRHFEGDTPRPARLASVANLASVTVAGSLEATHVVAIVGPRRASPSLIEGTELVAHALATRGVVVASGGAVGVDRAAHEGALAAGGVTWAVLPSGCEHTFPTEHGPLYARIEASGGALVWPFAPDVPARRGAFIGRNRVLASLADAVVVMEAPSFTSGTQSTIHEATKLGRPLWIVPPTPWTRGEAAIAALAAGAHPLYRVDDLLASLGLAAVPKAAARPRRADPVEQALVEVLAAGSLHPDEIQERSGLATSAVHRGLLTLSLESVVVDGPDGRYRLCR